MAIDCINKSPKLLQLIETDYQSIRLKSGSPEGGDDDKTYADWRVEDFDDNDGQFNATAFDSFDDAVSASQNYGSSNNVECAVWKLSDGSGCN